MTSLAAILLLALAAPAAEAPSHYPGASEAQNCTFTPAHDDDAYDWPPGWTRRRGPNFPRYVSIRVDDDRPPPGGRSLKVELNGGAASAFGPSIALNSGVDYVLEGYLKTGSLRHDAAWLSLTFLDAARQKLFNVDSEKVSGTSPWQKVCIGPLVPPSRATLLIVGIHVAPQHEEQDLHGTASFGSLWVGQLPRVMVTARSVEPNAPPSAADTAPGAAAVAAAQGAGDTSFLVFAQGKPIEIACLVSGFAAPNYKARLELDDYNGHKLAEHEEVFTSAKGNSARGTWRIPVNTNGFYRVHAQVDAMQSQVASASQYDPAATHCTRTAELGLAIVDPEAPRALNEFGWTLDPSDIALGLVPLGDLLGQSGIGWVKFPFVCNPTKEPSAAKAPSPAPPAPESPAKDKPSAAESTAMRSLPAASAAKRPEHDPVEPLISFSDRLADAGVRLVGVLQPPSVKKDSGQPADLLASEAFSVDTKTWYPSIVPVLARLANEIRFWQIGDDHDPGWIGCTDLSAAVARVKTELDKIGQDVNVGIAWSMIAPLPIIASPPHNEPEKRLTPDRQPQAAQKVPWRFLCLPCDVAMTDADLAARLDGMASAGIARWIAIDALPRDSSNSNDRIAQLVSRMLTAKTHRAEGIFFAHPFDPERGLVGRDGSPNELFLPWRTTAMMLGGGKYAGDIDLPGGNRIQCFGEHGRYVGAVATGRPLEEHIYLGDELQSRDLWGHATMLRPSDGLSLINVDRLSTFLTGLDGQIADWQLNVAFAPRSLPSVPSSAADVALEVTNPFPHAVSGRVHITGPRNWYIEPQIAEFRLDAGAAWKLPLEVALPNDVVAGRQMVAMEFEIQADRLYRFTMYRPINVTLGDIAFDGQALLSDGAELEVRQTLTNQGKRPVSLRCYLMAPDRRRQSTELLLQPNATSQFVYHLSDGRELLGKTLWLRAEEIDGPRVLNYPLEVLPTASPRGSR